MIAIVSYGLGNVRAFANIYERLGVPARIVTSAEALLDASHVVLPGVGSFDWAMRKLSDSGLRPNLEELALRQRKPVLGVCVGMQMMVERSDEGRCAGLGWVRGECRKVEASALPHMGWNDVVLAGPDPLFDGLGDKPTFYFLHSFHVVPKDGTSTLGITEYGGRLVCALRQQNLVGVQFHPEKSHDWGERLLLNFARS